MKVTLEAGMTNGSRGGLFGARRDVRVMELRPRLLLRTGLRT
jgi:hypothetical protein